MTFRERLAVLRLACPINRLTLLLAGRASRALRALRAQVAARRAGGRAGAG